MKLIPLSSAHYTWQQQYLNYLKNIKSGDIVYVGYDGKGGGGRCTSCKVVDIKDNFLTVEGVLWASDGKIITTKFDISSGELVDEDEDFYQLIMWEGYDISDGYFSDKYLKSLGLK